jgi:hypothetical protein
MCEYGVFQAGSPFSWADLGFKLFTMFAFGGWLFFDFMNRRLKNNPLMGSISRGFVLLIPLLVIDALLDIAFFGGLSPLVVPCCMVAYPATATGLFNIGCPFCFVTYKYPLLWGVFATYAISAALMLWTFLFQRSTSGLGESKKDATSTLKKALMVSLVLAIVGTVLLLIQVRLGSFSSV